MRKTLLLLAVAFMGHSHYTLAQSTCAQTLRLAQSVYDQGRLHELPNLLENCLADGFSDQEKVSAYKLLALTYIYLEEPEKADQAMLELLRTDNEFQINDAADPAEFVALYKTFKTAPIFRVGVKLGSIASQPSVISADYVNDGVSEYDYGFGFTGGLAFEIPLSGRMKKFTIHPELLFQIRSFSHNNDDTGSQAETTSTENVLEVDGKETQNWVSLPILLQYRFFEKGASNAFVALGASADYLLNATKNLAASRGDNIPIEAKSFQIRTQRNPFNAQALLSAGFKRKIAKGYFITEIRYHMGLMPMLKKEDTYENIIMVTDYKTVDGIYKMNAMSITLGYIFNRYNPKKLTSR